MQLIDVSVCALVGRISHKDSWRMEATFAVNSYLSSVRLSVPVSPSLPLPCVTVCHQISTVLYLPMWTGLGWPRTGTGGGRL